MLDGTVELLYHRMRVTILGTDFDNVKSNPEFPMFSKIQPQIFHCTTMTTKSLQISKTMLLQTLLLVAMTTQCKAQN